MDFTLFSIINGYAHSSWIFDLVSVFFATYALPIATGIILVVGIQRDRLLRCALYSSILAFAINVVIGFLFFRSRPFVDHTVIQLIEKTATQKSFPSDHAALSFALAASVSAFYPRMSVAAYAIAIVISLSRIAAGVHYPSDIIAGAVVGVTSFALIRRGLRL